MTSEVPSVVRFWISRSLGMVPFSRAWSGHVLLLFKAASAEDGTQVSWAKCRVTLALPEAPGNSLPLHLL